MKRLFLTLFAVVCLVGCAAPQRQIYQRQAQFIESEYAPYAGTGTATIKGQAFAKTRGGDVKFAAGNEVFMNPVTTYSTEWFDQWVIQGQPITPSVKESYAFTWYTVADGNGNFKFTNVPAGEYYIVSLIAWEYPSGGIMINTGAVLSRKITVKKGETVEIILPVVRGF